MGKELPSKFTSTGRSTTPITTVIDKVPSPVRGDGNKSSPIANKKGLRVVRDKEIMTSASAKRLATSAIESKGQTSVIKRESRGQTSMIKSRNPRVLTKLKQDSKVKVVIGKFSAAAKQRRGPQKRIVISSCE